MLLPGIHEKGKVDRVYEYEKGIVSGESLKGRLGGRTLAAENIISHFLRE